MIQVGTGSLRRPFYGFDNVPFFPVPRRAAVHRSGKRRLLRSVPVCGRHVALRSFDLSPGREFRPVLPIGGLHGRARLSLAPRRLSEHAAPAHRHDRSALWMRARPRQRNARVRRHIILHGQGVSPHTLGGLPDAGYTPSNGSSDDGVKFFRATSVVNPANASSPSAQADPTDPTGGTRSAAPTRGGRRSAAAAAQFPPGSRVNDQIIPRSMSRRSWRSIDPVRRARIASRFRTPPTAAARNRSSVCARRSRRASRRSRRSAIRRIRLAGAPRSSPSSTTARKSDFRARPASLASRASARRSFPSVARHARRERPASAARTMEACSRRARRCAPAASIVTTLRCRSARAVRPGTHTACSARHRTSRATPNESEQARHVS